MPEEPSPPPAVSQAELRGTLRQYVRWTLFAPAPRGAAAPPLCLPRRDGAVVTEEDVYAARPGAADPALDEAGRPRPRPLRALGGVPTLVRGPDRGDGVPLGAAHADAWRRYLQRELAAEPALLRFERDTVLALAERLSPRDRQAVWDVAHRSVAEAAQRHGCSAASVKLAARDALDRLLELLYAASARRVA